ncbi:hypothetical protein GCM10009844_38970 [Nocardioides koreensis]|uniref:Uncharacterized protein n=1 Tax=Nocardioides koreensis TaxID=433651 RepID=A0ABN3A4K7_9ACTN
MRALWAALNAAKVADTVAALPDGPETVVGGARSPVLRWQALQQALDHCARAGPS